MIGKCSSYYKLGIESTELPNGFINKRFCIPCRQIGCGNLDIWTFYFEIIDNFARVLIVAGIPNAEMRIQYFKFLQISVDDVSRY